MKVKYAFLSLLVPLTALAAGRQTPVTAVETAQRASENQIRGLIEPLLDKYCHDECKLMSISSTVDVATPDALSPGFDEVDPSALSSLAPSSARIKLLMDEKIGPISRGKLMELIRQYLETLDYPVKVDTQLAHFPQPIGSSGKIAELRDKITKQFKGSVDETFQKFCPNDCMFVNYELQTESVNPEETEYSGQTGEYVQDGGVAVRIKNIGGELLIDENLPQEERANILEMAKLKTNAFKNVTLSARSLKFPRPTRDVNGQQLGYFDGGRWVSGRNPASDSTSENSTNSENTTSNSNTNTNRKDENNINTRSQHNSTSTSSDTNQRKERFEHYEKIERVENGDAVQAELKKFKLYGLVFGCAVLALLIFIAMASWKPQGRSMSKVKRVIQNLANDPVGMLTGRKSSESAHKDRNTAIGARYEIEHLRDELMSIFAQQPKVAKYVFSRILTEEGTEVTACYIDIFGESIVMDMLRDPSLQGDMNELMEYYAKNPVTLKDDEKLELLQRLHNRTVAGKLVVMGSRSSHQFDFLAEMDGLQILELIRNESLTVKSIIMTQCDPQKRAAIYTQLDEETKLKLLSELSRIDYLPRDYISNVANALKRKRHENPKLNTEALPGSDVLVTLLERTGSGMQQAVIRNLETVNPESARTVKNKLVSLDTLRFLRDGQLLEVVLSLRHDELLQFLKMTTDPVRKAILSKSPKDLADELNEELAHIAVGSRETYQVIERKVLNRMKIMAQDGLVNLAETNERMFAESRSSAEATRFVQAAPPPPQPTQTNPGQQQGPTREGTRTDLKKVAGW